MKMDVTKLTCITTSSYYKFTKQVLLLSAHHTIPHILYHDVNLGTRNWKHTIVPLEVLCRTLLLYLRHWLVSGLKMSIVNVEHLAHVPHRYQYRNELEPLQGSLTITLRSFRKMVVLCRLSIDVVT